MDHTLHEGRGGVNVWTDGEKKKRIKGGRKGERERETKREGKNPQLPEPDQWQKCAHLLQNGPSRDVVPTERTWTRGQMKGEGDKGRPP